jgi:hypothetical protein
MYANMEWAKLYQVFKYTAALVGQQNDLGSKHVLAQAFAHTYAAMQTFTGEVQMRTCMGS